MLGSTPVLTRRALDYSSDSGFSAKLTEFSVFSGQFSAHDCAPSCAWQRLATKLPSVEHGRYAVARARIAPARSSGRPRYLRNAMVIHTARYRRAGRGCIRRTDRSHSIYPQCRRSIRGRPVINGDWFPRGSRPSNPQAGCGLHSSPAQVQASIHRQLWVNRCDNKHVDRCFSSKAEVGPPDRNPGLCAALRRARLDTTLLLFLGSDKRRSATGSVLIRISTTPPADAGIFGEQRGNGSQAALLTPWTGAALDGKKNAPARRAFSSRVMTWCCSIAYCTKPIFFI